MSLPALLAGIIVFEPPRFADERGFIVEMFRQDRLADAGVDRQFVQDNHCQSVRNSLRGLHFQSGRPQDKLISVTRGEIFDVAVDIRRESPTFGRWYGVRLSAENRRQIYIPSGFAHGFCVCSDVADVMYKFTDYFRPEFGAGIRWDDPDIGIDWPVKDPILSKQDRGFPLLKALETDRFPLPTRLTAPPSGHET
jgi:dTDP-4-dehydrorhamnose 3,5-epimerase